MQVVSGQFMAGSLVAWHQDPSAPVNSRLPGKQDLPPSLDYVVLPSIRLA
jgi:hypothetical protein